MGAKVFNLRRKDLNTKFKKYVKAYNLTSELELSISVQFSSVTQSCPTLCDTMNRSTPGLPVHHHLPEFTQTHVHQYKEKEAPKSIMYITK